MRSVLADFGLNNFNGPNSETSVILYYEQALYSGFALFISRGHPGRPPARLPGTGAVVDEHYRQSVGGQRPERAFICRELWDAAMLQWLLTKGPALDQQDRNGWAALHFAAQAYAVEMATLLPVAGVTVDVPDAYGNTPLWRAIFESRGQGGILKLLFAHGANPNQANDSGVAPRQLAETIANFDVKQFFAA